MLTKWLTTLFYLRPDEGAGGDGSDGSGKPPEGAAGTPDDGGDDGGEDKKVPLQALHKERERVKALQARLDAQDEKAKEAERAKLDELDRVKLEAKEAKDEATSLKSQIATATRQSLIRAAATKAGFLDPEDAVAFISTDKAEDEAAAIEAVKELAKKKKHLIAPPAGGSGGPRKVLENGKHVNDEGDDASADTFSETELKSFTQEKYAELLSDPKSAAKVRRSMAALKAAA